MFDFLREHWRHFRDVPAGRRFRRRYERRTQRSGLVRRILLMSVGTALIVLGIAMLVLPGPGLLAIVIGAGLLAEESLLAARALDRVDLAVSRRIRRWRRAENPATRRAPRA